MVSSRPVREMESLGVADAPRPPSLAATVLDPEGDLRLEIGPSFASFQVDSRSLARASAVWRNGLFGDAARTERVQGRPWIIQLPDDDETALSILLGIAHGVLPRSPGRYQPNEIYHLTIAAAKFDMIQLLAPWAESWCSPLIGLRLEDFESIVQCLRIGWELGHAGLYDFMAKSIVTRVEATGDGELVDPDGNSISSIEGIAPIIRMSHGYQNKSVLTSSSRLLGRAAPAATSSHARSSRRVFARAT